MVKPSAGGDATARAEAQQTSDEAQAKTPEQRAEHTGDPQYFEGTVIKIDKDGNEVMSDHVMPGETLRRAVSDTHFANPAQAKADEEAIRQAAKDDAKAAREAAEARNADDAKK